MFQKKFVEKIESHVMFNHAAYVTCKNDVEPGRRQMTIWRMHMACWKTKATDTCSLYVILIAFPLQQWLHVYASVFSYVTACQVLYFHSFRFNHIIILKQI